MNILVEMPRGYVTDTFLTPENIRRLEALGNVTWNQSEQHMSRVFHGCEILVSQAASLCTYPLQDTFGYHVLYETTRTVTVPSVVYVDYHFHRTTRRDAVPPI